MANTKYQEFPLTFEKGLVAEIEESVLDTGQAAELTNWEPATYGGLRTRNTWEEITKDGLTSPYRVRGFGSIATGTAVAGAVSAPVMVQKSVWPNGDADPVATKTVTLNGVNIGNVCIVVVTVDDLTAPTVTGGWTERAVSTGDRQHVRFYTKTAASSTEAFTYTIATARIRSLTMYEFKYIDAENPGSNWAAGTQTAISDGTDSLTVNATDSDGSLVIVGYMYDAGTPDSADSGTSGWTTPTDDGGNIRTGVTFQDLDQLDGKTELSGPASSVVYTSPSWTPPSTGIVIILIGVAHTGLSQATTLSVTGNGFTWHDCFDGGELGNAAGNADTNIYAWADCSSAVGTTGAITVTAGSGSVTLVGMGCSFMRAIGGDTTDPFIQGVSLQTVGTGTQGPTLSALLSGSGVVGIINSNTSTGNHVTANIGAGNWQGTLDAFDVDNAELSPGFLNLINTAYVDSAFPPDVQPTWNAPAGQNDGLYTTYEIRGAGNAGKSYHGPVTSVGSVIEEFDYKANKEMTAKMVMWGYTPPSVIADTVDFYIVMAIAQDSSTYKIYRIGRDDITTGTWEQIDVVTDATANSGFVSFAQGAGHLIWSSSALGWPRAIELATLSAFNITDLVGLAGRTAVYHKERMFMAGSTQNPSRLYFSEIGEPTNFTIATDFLDIGGDDGEAIQDLSSVEGLLLVPKTNRAYLISGSGVESFFVNELSGGTAAVGRSAIRTPYGTVLSGDDDVWVVQGGGTDPMSRPLGGGYDVAGTVSSAYAQDMALVADTGSETTWRINLVTGAWSKETINGTTDSEGVWIVFSLNGRLYYGCNDSSNQVGGTRRLTSARNYDFTVDGMQLRAATGRMAMFGPQERYTPRHLYLQLRSHDPTKPNNLFVTVETNLGSRQFVYEVDESTQREYQSVGWAKGVEWIKFYFECDASPEHAAIDVEKAVLSCGTEDY